MIMDVYDSLGIDIDMTPIEFGFCFVLTIFLFFLSVYYLYDTYHCLFASCCNLYNKYKKFKNSKNKTKGMYKILLSCEKFLRGRSDSHIKQLKKQKESLYPEQDMILYQIYDFMHSILPYEEMKELGY